MEGENKSVVKSIRIGEDTKQRLEKQLQEIGLSQDQYFNKVISLMELENAKQNNILVADITTLQSNLTAIEKSFISISEKTNNLLSNKDAEVQELNEKCKTMLFDKDNIIQNIKQDLQETNDLKNILKKENDDLQHEIEELNKKHAADMKQYEDTIETQKQLIENVNESIAELKEKSKQDKIEVEALKEDNFQLKEENSNLTCENTELNNSIKELKTEIAKLQGEREKEKAEHEEAIKRLEERLRFEEKQKTAELEVGYLTTFKEINEKNATKVEGLLEKIEKLQDELKNSSKNER